GVIDFHALRTAYDSNVEASGASVQVAQTPARHSTPNLIISIHAKAGLHDITGAGGRSARPGPPTHVGKAPATGTDGRMSKGRSPALRHAGDGNGRNLSDSVVMAPPDVPTLKGEKALDFSAPDGDSRPHGF